MISRRFFVTIIFLVGVGGCTLAATRPTQEMSDTTAALKAAKEVQADTLAPELYRQATEWYDKARHEYQLKNFKEAKEAAAQAKLFAERSEFEAINNGGNRTSMLPKDPTPPAPAPAPQPETTQNHNQSIYFESAEDQASKQKEEPSQAK